MIALEYWNGSAWVLEQLWHREDLAWISLGWDDRGYRTRDTETEEVLSDKSEHARPQQSEAGR